MGASADDEWSPRFKTIYVNLGCEDVMGSGVVSLVGGAKTMLRVSKFR